MDRFMKEVMFHERAEKVLPTLQLLDIDLNNRQIFLEWLGDDFYMQGLSAGGYDNVIPDWKEQWKHHMRSMWKLGIVKISLHPNSWVARHGVLVPFNWFFCDDQLESVSVKDVLIQISQERQEKLNKVLESHNMNTNTVYDVKSLQKIAFNSFRSNYPADLIDSILKDYFLQ
jgi:hypothetical protein